MNTETEQTILSRRSVRSFNGKIVNDDKIDRILKAAMAAPSARKYDPWRFIILKNSIEEAAKFCANGEVLRSAGNGILVYGNLNKTYDKEIGFMLQDCSAAIQNMLLSATALKIASCWMGIYPRENRIEGLQKLFNLSETEIPVGIVSLGYCDNWPAEETRYNSSFVRRE